MNVRPGKVFIDCTVGSGGHAGEILKQGGVVYGLDVDPDALKRAQQSGLTLTQANFKDLAAVARVWELTRVAGVLLDLGLSSEQIEDQNRGFSWQSDGPLDMRADPNLALTAADLVNGLGRGELIKLFRFYGEEPRAKQIAEAIVAHRPIKTTGQLATAIEAAQPLPRLRRARSHHPATLVFQALRIAVNDELNNLKAVLPQAADLLEPGGRLAVVSFHSLEDRIVKNFMRENKALKIITKKPVISDRPHALLRVAEKL